MPAVTVLLPTHDHQGTLYASIESVRRQTLTDFKLIVIGDGAPLRTRQIVEALNAADPRISYRQFPKSEPQATVVGDAAAIPLRSAVADLAVAFMTLQDVDDLAATVRELGRVLRPGGALCIAILHPLATVRRPRRFRSVHAGPRPATMWSCTPPR